MSLHNDTICAVATGTGGAIAVIRVSGPRSIDITDKIFLSRNGHALTDSSGYKLHYGDIIDNNLPEADRIDEVIVSVFRSPRSYTGEDMTEISCHGSDYIKGEILKLLILNGARMAEPGEFTLKAFLAGKLDLMQAEAVADIISAEDSSAHRIAAAQMRGGAHRELTRLRQRLTDLISLLELELDFSEEEVEFADRNELTHTIKELLSESRSLADSFHTGNAIKSGIPVAIAGAPNSGKSTLLNTLLDENRAITSDIAGTTRDVIEDTVAIDGYRFRLADTAGIRETEDELEKLGIERSRSSIDSASVIVHVIDITECIDGGTVPSAVVGKEAATEIYALNKSDKLTDKETEIKVDRIAAEDPKKRVIAISAKNKINITELKGLLVDIVKSKHNGYGDALISNSRHYASLVELSESLGRAAEGLNSGLPTDLVAQDIREALHHIGTITGEVTTDDVLANIFGKFCIGK